MGRSSGAVLLEKNIANPVMNGGFEIWQRGTAFTTFPSGIIQYTADRWGLQQISGGAFQVRSAGDAPAVSAFVPTPLDCLEIAATTGVGVPSATQYVFLRQTIEGSIWLPFTQRQLALNFWVKSHGVGATGVQSVSMSNAGQDQGLVAEYTIPTADVWQFVTIPIPPSSLTAGWHFDNSAGLYLNFMLGAGSNWRTSSLGSWQPTVALASNNQTTSVLNTAGNWLRIWGVSISPLPVAVPYWPRPIPQELAACKRYFEYYGKLSPSEQLGIGMVSAAGISLTPILFSEKRATPTVTPMGPPANYTIAYTNIGVAATSMTIDAISAGAARVNAGFSGGPAVGSVITLQAAASADARFAINADF